MDVDIFCIIEIVGENVELQSLASLRLLLFALRVVTWHGVIYVTLFILIHFACQNGAA